MSNKKISEDNSDKHTALERLWPTDAKESKKLADLKQQKTQKLVDLGLMFKAAREALGYNISELNEHTGLSFSELEAMEHGQFQKIEQQDYIDYYVHTYAALLGLEADEILESFKQSFYDAHENIDETQPDTTEASIETIIENNVEYDAAFAEEVKHTQAAIENSNYDPALTEPQLSETDMPRPVVAEPQLQSQNEQAYQENKNSQLQKENLEHSFEHEPIRSFPELEDERAFPWITVGFVSVFIIAASIIGYYYYTNKIEVNSIANITPKAAEKTDKIDEKIPDSQIAKKIGTLETNIITKGSDNLNAPTADVEQKPLIISKQALNSATKAPISASDKVADIIGDTIGDAIDNTIKTPNKATDELTDDVKKAANDASLKLSSAIKTETKNDSGLADAKKIVALNVKETVQTLTTTTPDVEALPEVVKTTIFPTDPTQYTLEATKSSWVLIEDDSQILFSDELQPGKIFTLPKLKGVIVSLGDAGVINVYKGDKLIGKLGKSDESLDLVSIEQRFNQLQKQ